MDTKNNIIDSPDELFIIYEISNQQVPIRLLARTNKL